MNTLIAFIFSLPFLLAFSSDLKKSNYDPTKDTLRFNGELHLRNIRQLTFVGNNAEAYWSFDDKQLVFQSDSKELHKQGCDQIFTMNADGSSYKNGSTYQLVSTGKGRTTCSYYLKDGRLIFASTHEGGESCPESKMFAGGRYVWPLFDTYDIYTSNPDGSNTELLIGGKGYDAEATASPDGRYVIFTSTRSGDLELWRYEIKTKKLLQLTNSLGYDGGAFFSRDSKQIVWRASRPKGEDAESYKKLLSEGYVEPKELDIFIADIDGNNVKQITNLPGANWAPFFHPSGKKVLFCSNHHSQKEGGRRFDIFMINVDGTGLVQITNSGLFDAFPMFSFDGKKLVFCSNRRADRKPTRDTNVFVADWIDEPEETDLNFKSLR
ncbi:MAG: WD40 domain-containing protein [Ignavibacteria bacterium]|nr:MAG: WD40 domain-containing protein [Ignavibacteria bacterium]KAF0157635.1 MAG: WD40 domain-containing protein [Ignavibacteria bacterium]